MIFVFVELPTLLMPVDDPLQKQLLPPSWLQSSHMLCKNIVW